MHILTYWPGALMLGIILSLSWYALRPVVREYIERTVVALLSLLALPARALT